MDTTGAYFWPGDEELEVWVVPPAHEAKKMGYIKGEFQNQSGIMRLGVIKDNGGWSEEVIQKMAETMMEEGFIFFFLRVVSTTSLDVIEQKDVAKYRIISDKHRKMADQCGTEGDREGLRYHHGVIDGLGVLLSKE